VLLVNAVCQRCQKLASVNAFSHVKLRDSIIFSKAKSYSAMEHTRPCAKQLKKSEALHQINFLLTPFVLFNHILTVRMRDLYMNPSETKQIE
jgi:hypothetical protein